MAYQNLDVKEAFRVYTGGNTVTVASTSKDGVADVMTVAWNCPYDSDEIIVILALSHTTTENILDTGKFVVAIPEALQKEQILKVGSMHGRDCGDKFTASGVEYELSQKYSFKVLKNCLAYFECTLSDKELLKKTGICMGHVENLYVRAGLWNEEFHNFKEGAKLALHHVTEDQFLSGGKDA